MRQPSKASLERKRLEAEILHAERQAEIELKRAEADVKKAETEITNLVIERERGSWFQLWLKPATWALLLPALAAIFTAYQAYEQDFFEKQKEAVADEQRDLELKTREAVVDLGERQLKLKNEIEEEEAKLDSQKKEFDAQRIEIEAQTQKLLDELESSKEQLRQAQQEFEEEKREIATELGEIESELKQAKLNAKLEPLRVLIKQVAESPEDHTFGDDGIYNAIYTQAQSISFQTYKEVVSEFDLSSNFEVAFNIGMLEYHLSNHTLHAPVKALLDEKGMALIYNLDIAKTFLKNADDERRTEFLMKFISDMDIDIEDSESALVFATLFKYVCQFNKCVDELPNFEAALRTLLKVLFAAIEDGEQIETDDIQSEQAFQLMLSLIDDVSPEAARLIYANSSEMLADKSKFTNLFYIVRSYEENADHPDSGDPVAWKKWAEARREDFLRIETIGFNFDRFE